MKALPQAIAKGRNQNGTIAGKLKGTIAAQTPTGWRTVSASIPRETSSMTRPCIVVGIAAAASTISIIRADLGAGVGDRLAHLGRDRAGEVLTAADQLLAQREEAAAALDHADGAPLGQRPRAAATARSRSSAVESGTSARVSPLAGLVTSRCSAPELGPRRRR